MSEFSKAMKYLGAYFVGVLFVALGTALLITADDVLQFMAACVSLAVGGTIQILTVTAAVADFKESNE